MDNERKIYERDRGLSGVIQSDERTDGRGGEEIRREMKLLDEQR